MGSIDIFYQGEGIREIAHIEADPDHTFKIVKITLIEKHGLADETFIFIEDRDEPMDEQCFIRDHVGPAGIKAHVHRCREVHVGVTFNGKTEHHKFGPAATVVRVKKWAAEKKFGMTPQEAGEHVLQISSTKDRPDPNAHIGTLAHGRACSVAFDLVPNERINGAPNR